jgi:drug/metabolite transporter (DMT)-like permease
MVHRPGPPITLNFLRWGWCVHPAAAAGSLGAEAGQRPVEPLAALRAAGPVGRGRLQRLQYLALKTSTPINVTLVASSMPVWMLGVGALFFGQTITRRQLLGAALSMAGVLLVLCRGEWGLLLQVRLVPG